MSLVGIGVGGAVALGAGASLIGTGVSAGMSSSAQGQSRADYKAGLKAAADMYKQSRNDINKYMTPYVNSGTRNLGMLNSALDPTAMRDYSMPDAPGAVPQWADYQNRNILPNGANAPQPVAQQTPFKPRQPRKPGLAGMVGG